MIEAWERAEIKRLEERIASLERKNWERSEQFSRWIVYSCLALSIAIVAATVATAIAHHAH